MQAGMQAGMQAPARKRARSLERLLKSGKLPESARAQKENELAELLQQAQRTKRVEREKLNSRKYHGVKFFERRKLERRIESLKRKLGDGSSGGGEAERLEEQLRTAEHDRLYVLHFPRNKKYLSLFPSSDADNEAVAKLRKKIRDRIVRQAEAGKLGPPEEDEGGDDEPEAAELEASEAALAEDAFFAAASDDDEEEEAAAAAEGEADNNNNNNKRRRQGLLW